MRTERNEAAVETAASKASPGAGREGVQDQSVAREEFVLVFPDHGLARLGPGPPMDALDGVPGAVIAQGHEFLGIAHRGRIGHAPGLAAARSGRAQARDGMAAGQDQDALGRGGDRRRPGDSQGFGQLQAQGLELQSSPARGRQGTGHGRALARLQAGNRSGGGGRPGLGAQGPPPGKSRVPRHPVGLGRGGLGGKFRTARCRSLEKLEHLRPFQGAGAVVGHADAVAHRQALGGGPGQGALRREPGTADPGGQEGGARQGG